MRVPEDQWNGQSAEGDIYVVRGDHVRITPLCGPNFYHLISGSARIRNFDPLKDHLDFGPKGPSSTMQARILGANILLTDRMGLSVTLIDASRDFLDLDASLTMTMSQEARLDALCPYLRRMTRDDVADLTLETMGPDGSTLFGDDPIGIRRAFPAAAAWEINNILHPDHAGHIEGHPDKDTRHIHGRLPRILNFQRAGPAGTVSGPPDAVHSLHQSMN